MAAEEDVKFGSSSWFKAWGERLLQGAIDGVTNVLTPNTVQANVPTVTPGSVAQSALPWFPIAILGAALLILVLVLKKKS